MYPFGQDVHCCGKVDRGVLKEGSELLREYSGVLRAAPRLTQAMLQEPISTGTGSLTVK